MDEFEIIRLKRISNCLALRGSTKITVDPFNSKFLIEESANAENRKTNK